MKYLLYVLYALWAMIRALAAFPFMIVMMGAYVAGDEETEKRVERLIDRIVGIK